MSAPTEDDSNDVTVIRGGTIIAYDSQAHKVLDDGVLAFRRDRIVHVGRGYDGPAGTVIDGRGKLTIPGQISTHAHVSAQEGSRLLVDGGRRDFFRSGFLNYLPTKSGGGASFLAEQDAEASLRFGLASLIRNGVTTVVPFAPGGTDNGATFARMAGEMGLRVYYAPLSTGGRYTCDSQGRVHLDIDEAAGLAGLERAAAFIEENAGTFDDRLRGILVIDEFYNSTPGLRRRAKEVAGTLGVGLTMHFCEQLKEFHETVLKTGRTPVQLLEDEGILGPEVILAHALYLAGHSMTAYPYVDDLEILGRSGTSVAHSPVAFARRGAALESFQRYLDHGINLALGTDSYPLDMFGEMRAASLVGKIIDKNHEAAGARDVFNASNLGGAQALGRDDLGRLATGAKADIVMIDTETLSFGPNPDPVRALVHLGSGSLVDRVIVDGRTLVADKKLLVCDERETVIAAKESGLKVWGSFSNYHWAGASASEAFPPAFDRWED